MRLYGLIGYPLTHSFSKKYFTAKFSREGVEDCQYELFSIPSIEEVPDLLKAHPDLCGLNVTIPYKEKILAYVDQMDEVVKQVRAANCIHIKEGRLIAYNTDVRGFEQSLLAAWQPHHRKALILGTGGASKAVAYVLGKLGLEPKFVSRQPAGDQFAYEQVTETLLRDYTLVVNTTPVGTYPQEHLFPALPYQAVTDRHYFFDLVYNPELTLFLKYAGERGAVIRNGHDMLAIQAEESWKIWNDQS